jgi:hypothetical protein
MTQCPVQEEDEEESLARRSAFGKAASCRTLA